MTTLSNAGRMAGTDSTTATEDTALGGDAPGGIEPTPAPPKRYTHSTVRLSDFSLLSRNSPFELDRISTDRDVQLREQFDDDRIELFKQWYEDETDSGPLVVFRDGERYLLADGHQRLMALRHLGRNEANVTVYRGDAHDAYLYALLVNNSGSQPLTREEKEAAIVRLERDPQTRRWADTKKAALVGVRSITVARIRNKHGIEPYAGPREHDRAGKQVASDTSKCGRRPTHDKAVTVLADLVRRFVLSESDTPSSTLVDKVRHDYGSKADLVHQLASKLRSMADALEEAIGPAAPTGN